MKLSISSIAWTTDEDDEVVELLARHGVSAIDLVPGRCAKEVQEADLGACKEVKAWWQARGIEFAGMQSLLFGTQGLNLFGSAEVQRQMLDHLTAVCRIADALDVRRLVFGSPKNRDRSGLNEDIAFAMACEFFSTLASHAERFGVVMCLEPNPTCYGCNFMTTTTDAAAVVMAVNHPNIKLQFDTGSIHISGEDPHEICTRYHHLIGHLHASEPQLLPVGTGGCDHLSCAKAINEFMPEVTITIEMLTNKAPNRMEAIETSIQYCHHTYGNGSPGGCP